MAALQEIGPAAVTQVTPEETRKAIKGFPKRLASGPTGLKPQHLNDVMIPGMANEKERQIYGLVNIMAGGQAPECLQTWLCGASLVALPKTSVGH